MLPLHHTIFAFPSLSNRCTSQASASGGVCGQSWDEMLNTALDVELTPAEPDVEQTFQATHMYHWPFYVESLDLYTAGWTRS